MKNKIKVIVAIISALVVLITSVSCGKNNNGGTGSTGGNANASVASPEELLSSVWEKYADDEKFFAMGGDEQNINENGPGKYSVEDAEVLDNVLGFPAAEIGKIDGAASLMHAMNQNTFTCGVFHFKDAKDVANGIAALKSNILARNWICGFPDKLMIAKVSENYVIAVWGIDEGDGIVSRFKQKLEETFSDIQIVVNETIV